MVVYILFINKGTLITFVFFINLLDIFFEFNMGAVMIGIIGAGFCAFVGVGIQSLMAIDGLNLPVMTIPFIVTTWLLMSIKTKWLVATVADDIDLDDAMFLDRRHDGEEQAAIRQLIQVVKSPGRLAELLKGNQSLEDEGRTKYGALDDEFNFENDSLLDGNDQHGLSSDDDDDDKDRLTEIEMV